MKILIAGVEIVTAEGLMNPSNSMSSPMAPPNVPGFPMSNNDPGVQGPGGSDPYRGDIAMEGVGFPYKHFEEQLAEPKIPSNLQKANRIANPYPALQNVFGQERKKEEMKKGKYPVVQQILADLSDDAHNLEKLGIDDPAEFAPHFQGQIDQLAEEHDLGELLGYVLADRVIIIIGEANVLMVDYEFENPQISPFYLFEASGDDEIPEGPVEEPVAEEPAAEEPESEEAE